MTALRINTDHLPTPADVDPEELHEVLALVQEAHELEPIRTVDDLANTGRFVVYPEARRLAKDYRQEWPVAKELLLVLLFQPMHLSHSASATL